MSGTTLGEQVSTFFKMHLHAATHYIINSSLHLATALILWAFNISQDPSCPIDTMNFSDGQSIRPNPFVVNFEPRVGNMEVLIGASFSQ